MFVARTPRPALTGVVELLWYAEGATTKATKEWVMPFGRGQLLINLADDHIRWYRKAADVSCLSSIALTGPYSRPLLIDTADQTRVVGVSLTALGTRWLARSAAATANQMVSAKELEFDRQQFEALRRAVDGIHACQHQLGPEVVLDRIESALLSSSRPRVWNHGVRAALAELDSASSISEVADRIGWSRRRLSREFSEDVGLKPKLYQRLRRFRRGLTALSAPAPGSGSSCLASVAAELGFTDQSHFNLEFREFSGMTPSSYLRHRTGYTGHVRAHR